MSPFHTILTKNGDFKLSCSVFSSLQELLQNFNLMNECNEPVFPYYLPLRYSAKLIIQSSQSCGVQELI